ncbi:HAMP domain-containing protein [Paracoccaceae bacterium]|nr:HAMP domain-containing protein [Paracoccaceae bacterium]
MNLPIKIFGTTLIVFLIMTVSAIYSIVKISEINNQLHLISKVYNPMRNLASEIEIIFLEENLDLEKIEKIEYELNEIGTGLISHEDHKLQGDINPDDIADNTNKNEELIKDLKLELVKQLELFEKYFDEVEILVSSIQKELEKAQDLTENIDEKIQLSALHANTVAISMQHNNFHQRSESIINFKKMPLETRLNIEMQLDNDADQLIKQLDELRNKITFFSDSAVDRAAKLEEKALYSSVIATISSGFASILLSSFLIIGILRPMKALTAGAKRIEEGDLEIKLEPRSGDEVGTLTKSFNSMAAGLRSTQQIKDTFGQYVDPRIVSNILGDHVEGDTGRKEIASVYFSDIAGFSSLSEKFTPSGLVRVLNRYFDVMSTSVSDKEGVIDKYIGDAVMAFWAPPFCEQNSCASLSVGAAIQNIAKLVEFQSELPELTGLRQGAPRLDQRIGIATGDAVIGSIGSASSKNYTIIGDTVNLAARLEGANKIYGTDLLVCERTANSAEGVMFRLVDKITVHGKSEPNFIYTTINDNNLNPGQTSEIIEMNKSGFSHYLEGNFEKSKQYYLNILGIYPNDRIANIFISRNEILMNQKTTKDWDGIWKLNKK